jgi:hypothetical protein
MWEQVEQQFIFILISYKFQNFVCARARLAVINRQRRALSGILLKPPAENILLKEETRFSCRLCFIVVKKKIRIRNIGITGYDLTVLYVGSRCEGAEAFLGRIYVHRSDLEGGLAQAYPGSRLQFNLVPGRDTATLRAVKVGPGHRKEG